MVLRLVPSVWHEDLWPSGGALWGDHPHSQCEGRPWAQEGGCDHSSLQHVSCAKQRNTAYPLSKRDSRAHLACQLCWVPQQGHLKERAWNPRGLCGVRQPPWLLYGPTPGMSCSISLHLALIVSEKEKEVLKAGPMMLVNSHQHLSTYCMSGLAPDHFIHINNVPEVGLESQGVKSCSQAKQSF